MSSSFLWQLMRKTSSTRVVRNGKVMCSGKGSLSNKYTASDNGLSSSKAINVSDVKGDIVLSLKSTRGKSQRRPRRMWNSFKLKGGVSKAMATASDKVETYWPGKEGVVKSRVSRLLQAQRRTRKIQRNLNN